MKKIIMLGAFLLVAVTTNAQLMRAEELEEYAERNIDYLRTLIDRFSKTE